MSRHQAFVYRIIIGLKIKSSVLKYWMIQVENLEFEWVVNNFFNEGEVH